MAAITIGTTGATWGLSAETGVLVQSINAKVSREKNQVRNETGEFVLVSFYNPLQTIQLQAVTTATSGINAAAPGVALTLAYSSTLNGVTQGGIYTDDVEVPRTNTEFKKITVNATQYPLI